MFGTDQGKRKHHAVYTSSESASESVADNSTDADISVAGGDKRNSFVIFAKQCLITIGCNFVPIPGAMGISDYLMIDGFTELMGWETAFSTEMISRGITFYICVAVCGLITLIGYLAGRKKNDRSL